MITILTKTLRKNIFTLLIYTIISSAFVWMYVGFYPSIAAKSETLQKAFEAYPKEMLQAFDIELEAFISSFEGFIAGEHLSIIWPIIMIILIVVYASSAIAGEIEKGTVELLLSQPISRLKVFLAKYLAGLLIISAFVALSTFSVVPLATLHGVDIRIQNFFTFSILGFLFAFAIYGMTILFSTISSSKGKPAAITGGILIIMYAINIFSTFQDSVEFLKYLSFFHYYDFNSAILKNQISVENLTVFLSFGFITAFLALYIFNNRDISTT